MAFLQANTIATFPLVTLIALLVINGTLALSEGNNIKQEAVSYWRSYDCNFPPRAFYNENDFDVCDLPYRPGDRTSGLCRFFFEVSKDLCYDASGESEDAQMLEMLDSYILVLDNKRLCHIFLSMDRGGIIPEANDLTRSWYEKARSVLTTERSCAAVCDSPGMHPLCVAIFVAFEYIRDVQPALDGDLFRNPGNGEYQNYDYMYDDNQDQLPNNGESANTPMVTSLPVSTGSADDFDNFETLTLANQDLTGNNTAITTPEHDNVISTTSREYENIVAKTSPGHHDATETPTEKDDTIEDVFEFVDYSDVKDVYGTERTTTTQDFPTQNPLYDVNKTEKEATADQFGQNNKNESATRHPFTAQGSLSGVIGNESTPLPGQQNGSFQEYTWNKNKGDVNHRLPDVIELKKEEQMNYYAVLLGCCGLLIASLLYVIYKNKRAIAMLVAAGRKGYRSAPRIKKTDGYQPLGQQDIA